MLQVGPAASAAAPSRADGDWQGRRQGGTLPALPPLPGRARRRAWRPSLVGLLGERRRCSALPAAGARVRAGLRQV